MCVCVASVGKKQNKTKKGKEVLCALWWVYCESVKTKRHFFGYGCIVLPTPPHSLLLPEVSGARKSVFSSVFVFEIEFC